MPNDNMSMPNKSIERGGDQRGPTGRMAKDPRPARRPLQPFDRPALHVERSPAVIVWVALGLVAWLGLGFGILWWAQR